MAELRRKQNEEREEDMRKKSAAMDAVMEKMHQEFLATKEGSVVNAAKDALDAWSKKNRGAGAVLQITFPEGVTPKEFYTIFKEQIDMYPIDGHQSFELDFFFDESKRINGDPGKMFVNNANNFGGRANDYLAKLLDAMKRGKRGSGKTSRRRRSTRSTRRR
jgi:hypothetical protein